MDDENVEDELGAIRLHAAYHCEICFEMKGEESEGGRKQETKDSARLSKADNLHPAAGRFVVHGGRGRVPLCPRAHG